MQSGFVNAVSALCYSILWDQPRSLPTGEDCDVSPNAVVNFVLHQHARMPDYLRFPFFFLTLAFDCSGVLLTGTRFHRMDHSERQRQIELWRSSRFSFPRDFIRLYEGLAVFCWYSILSARLEVLEQARVAESDATCLRV